MILHCEACCRNFVGFGYKVCNFGIQFGNGDTTNIAEGLFLLLTRLLVELFVFMLENGDGRSDSFIDKIRISKFID